MSPIPVSESNIPHSTPETELHASDFYATAETIAEPLPEWSKATEQWGGMWEFHRYGLGVVYALIFILAWASLLKQFKNTRGTSKQRVPKVVLILLCVFSLTRCLFLCNDAYHWRETSPVVITKLLWGIGQPCLITAFTLVFIVIRNAFVLRQKFQNWYTTRNVAIATLPYLVITLATEITLSFIPAFKGLTFTCQFLYLIFALLLSVFYAIISVFVWRKFTSVRSGNHWVTPTANRGTRTRSILRMCIAAVVGGAALSVMQLYAMFSVYGVFSNTQYVAAWPWLAFQTFFRILEIYMAFVLYCAVTEKSVVKKRGDIAPTTAGSASPPSQRPALKNQPTMEISVMNDMEILPAEKKIEETEMS